MKMDDSWCPGRDDVKKFSREKFRSKKVFFKTPFFRGLPFTFINQFTTNHHTIHQHQHCNISQWAEGREN